MPVPEHWPALPREAKNVIARKLVERQLERCGTVADLLRSVYMWTARPDGTRVDSLASAETLYAYVLEDAGLAARAQHIPNTP